MFDNFQKIESIFNETISSCKSLKFLGITFNFVEHVKDIKKCSNRLNIMKTLSNKKCIVN
jgi:hypothetical protein